MPCLKSIDGLFEHRLAVSDLSAVSFAVQADADIDGDRSSVLCCLGVCSVRDE